MKYCMYVQSPYPWVGIVGTHATALVSQTAMHAPGRRSERNKRPSCMLAAYEEVGEEPVEELAQHASAGASCKATTKATTRMMFM